MKNIVILLLFFYSISALSQVPYGFNYQATVRDNNGDLIKNQEVIFKFNIISGLPENTPVYSETNSLITDDLGQINTIVGQGNTQIGQFNQIDWSTGIFHLNIELNTGSGFVNLGTTQFLSVPFSFYSKKSGTSQQNKTLMYLSDGF
jgi:hypothetical protein